MYNITICVSTIFCKSEEDYLKKISRGLGDRVGSYDMSGYKYYDKMTCTMNVCCDINLNCLNV